MRAELGSVAIMMQERPVDPAGFAVGAAHPLSSRGLLWQPEFRQAWRHQEGQDLDDHLEWMQAATDYLARSIEKAADELVIPVVNLKARPKTPASIIRKPLAKEPDTPWRKRSALRDYYGVILVVRQGENPAQVAKLLQEYFGMPDADELGRPTIISGYHGNPHSTPRFREIRNKVFIQFDYDGQSKEGEVQIYDEIGWEYYQMTRKDYESKREKPRTVYPVDSGGVISVPE